MGMIVVLKVVYKMKLLETLIDIFDDEEKHDFAAKARAQMPRGCKGVMYGVNCIC